MGGTLTDIRCFVPLDTLFHTTYAKSPSATTKIRVNDGT